MPYPSSPNKMKITWPKTETASACVETCYGTREVLESRIAGFRERGGKVGVISKNADYSGGAK